jgi:hypothetical protein
MPGELTLIVADLYLASEHRGPERGGPERGGPERGEPDRGVSRSQPAQLRSLELLLARAGACESVEWRSWLAGMAGLRVAPVPVAAISRWAAQRTDTAPLAGDYWLATPVHLEAALDHVRLAKVLSLSTAEWKELAASLPDVLDPAIATFSSASGPHAFLAASQPLQATTVDPVRIVGADVHDFLPAGADASQLKRVMTELQMWLHEHPLNARRTQGGQLPVNGLWVWGGGGLPADVQAHAQDLPALLSSDSFASGLWRLVGGEPRALPASLDDAGTSHHSLVVAVTLRLLAGDTDGERMAEFDRSWVRPALAMLRTGALRRLRLHLNDRLFTATRADLWQIWRRPRPWLELVG